MKPNCSRPSPRLKLLGLLWAFTAAVSASSFATPAVTVREQEIVLPTYAAGAPELNPMFYYGVNSQGAQGRVYPYPLYDTLTHTKSNRTYRIVYLENEYVRVGILPEIGGRLFEAVDKSNGYDFVYRQHVIKPALIGLIGAWISGGIEWNIPHHHRATTFLPVQSRIESQADGSKTVWVGELEVRHRMRWAVGYTLRPGKSYLECSVRIVNRTPVSQSMLCFANVAVHANPNYQVIFPPSTEHVTFHGKHEFTTWPMATTWYNHVDFRPGVDVSWYSNHFAANSMFAWNCQEDFFAGYDHGKEAGTMSIADHHLAPGKKFWTWGNGPRGRMWDHILTDTDGPYMELMVGAYSDNQPDYSWLQPYETRDFTLYWYPFRDIGGVKNANLEAAVNLEASTNGVAKVGFCTTAAYPKATVLLRAGAKVLWREVTAINPAKPILKQVAVPDGISPTNLHASLLVDGKEMVGFSPVPARGEPTPKPAQDPPAPEKMKTVEELYLAGLRIEQFHAPGRPAEDYWEEALRRDPGDARVNMALGTDYIKRARFVEAEALLRRALERLGANYTSVKDAEPLYYLGVALEAQGRLPEAYDAFYKAAWCAEWKGPAFFSLAEIAAARGDLRRALDHTGRALEANARNLRALNLRAAMLRHLDRQREAKAVLTQAASLVDPLDVRTTTERWLLGDSGAGDELRTTLRNHPHTGLETAAEYQDEGLWQEGSSVLQLMVDVTTNKSAVSPLAYYDLAYFAEQLGDRGKAAEYRRLAMRMSPDYVFPFQWESVVVLRGAMEADPRDARAPYYLGNLLYDWQPAEAIKCWERSAALDASFPIVHRNLARAYARQGGTNSLEKAIASLEKAVALPHPYPIHFAELDALYAKAGTAPGKRLALLERNHEVVARRDDALNCEIGLKVSCGKLDEAINLMTGRTFSVWEGGSLDVAEHWVEAHLLRGEQKFKAGEFQAALADFQAAASVPDNLPDERDKAGGHAAEVSSWLGRTYEALGDPAKAKQ